MDGVVVPIQMEFTVARIQTTILQQIVERLAQRGQLISSRSRFVPLTGKDPSRFDALIEAAARRHGLSADLIKAVIRTESNFDPTAISTAGAKGLMQLMDATAAELGVKDSFDPAQNIEGGAAYLRQMLDRYGQVSLALAAYNAGPGAVDRYAGIPPYAETQTYVRRVLQAIGASEWQA